MFGQTFKNIDDIFHKDAGCLSELDYTEQSSWMLFLKYLDDLEQEKSLQAELVGKDYQYIIDEEHRWSTWAAPKDAQGNFVIQPKIGETIYDGAAGSAGFLCEAYDYLRQGGANKKKLSTRNLKILQESTFYAKEKKSLAYVIAIMNMILHGIEAPNVIHTNTLGENLQDITSSHQHDIVLATPPIWWQRAKRGSTKLYDQNRRNRLFDSTMILYSKIRPYLMKVCRPEFIGLCSADIYPLSPIKQKVDKHYLFYLLLSKDFTEDAINGSGRAGMPKVNRTHLFNYPISVPSIKTQREFVVKINQVAKQSQILEDLYRSKLLKLDELKKSTLHKVFTGELTKTRDKKKINGAVA